VIVSKTLAVITSWNPAAERMFRLDGRRGDRRPIT